MKVSDVWTVPLCWKCHHELHTAKLREGLFWSMKGVDPIDIAKRLWRSTNETST